MDIKKEMNGVEEQKKADMVNEAEKKKSFITYSHSSEHAFIRFEAVKKAYDILQNAIAETGGVMPVETTDAYEAVAGLLESIKVFELDTIKNGR